MSDSLFLTLVDVLVAKFLAILFGRVAVKRRVPTAVNCLINPALILPLVLIVVDLPYRDSLSYEDILDRGIGSSQPSRRVQFSSSVFSCSRFCGFRIYIS